MKQKLEIVKEEMPAIIGDRYYVIAVPINETGICKQFETTEEAQTYVDELNKQEETNESIN